MSDPLAWFDNRPRVLLIGCGVVGQAIAEAHLAAGVPFVLLDQDSDALESAAKRIEKLGGDVSGVELPLPKLFAMEVRVLGTPPDVPNVMAIESIVEKLDVKRALFAQLQAAFGEELVLCSNTSTLRIDEIAEGLRLPERIAGMHFFMPVHQRAAVEVVRGQQTSPETDEAVQTHARMIGKQAIVCRDSPGFIVNRMLSPYLNQSLLLLCRGAAPSQIERAALAYGMPLSPLELIDWIGAPTMFHAGRAFWQAFPSRIDPSPLVPAMIKANRLGRACGRGIYDYCEGERSSSVADETMQLIERYQMPVRSWSDGEILVLLSIPMWIEARHLLEAGVVPSMASIDLAMAGGLGYSSDHSWSQFFAELGDNAIDQAMTQWSSTFRSMTS